MFFDWFVAKRSSFETFKNGGISTEHLIEYEATELFCKSQYVCVLILLHLTCSKMFQLTHWMTWWGFATGLQQIIHGNFTTMQLIHLFFMS